jgi:hypothetical protein
VTTSRADNNPLDIARDYIARGWNPIPIPYRAKGPTGDEWGKLRITDENVEQFFDGSPQNIGVQLGKKSDGLTDVDLDCPEAVVLAPQFLPSTPAVFGRASKPRSHYLYCIDDAPNKGSLKLTDLDKAVIVELRMGGGDKGAQTVFPGSIHTSGETIEWVSDREPTQTSFAVLKDAVTKIAVGVILIRSWPAKGGRHDAALALGGFLARAGWETNDIANFVEIVAHAAGSEDPAARSKDATDSAEAHARGENVYGLPGLCQHFGGAEGEKIAKFLEYRESAPHHGPSPAGTISVNPGELPRVVDEAEAAILRADCGIYQRGTSIVRAVWSKLKAADNQDTFAHLLIPVDEKYLVETLTRAVVFNKWNVAKKRYQPIDCPNKVAATYLARVGQWKLPVLAGVINAPCLRHDGSILSKPGYDEASGLLFEPNGVVFPPIPENPTKDDALKAIGTLKDLLEEFPFVNDADKSVSLSLIFTALDRRSMRLVPVHGITAPVIGTGKTYMIEIVSTIATGNIAPVIPQGWNDEELEKRLSAALIAGQGIIVIDNCTRPVGGSFFNLMITSERVNVRILGKSEQPDTPTNVLVIVNGNNLSFHSDFTRRVVVSSLDPKMEKPWMRKFKRDPIAEIKRRRGEIVVAALTVLRAYHIAKPRVDLTPFASFEDYNHRIVGPLLWLGEKNPRENINNIIAEDPEREEISEFMRLWWDAYKDAKKTVSDVIGAMVDKNFDGILQEIASDKYGRPSSVRLGRWLRKHRGRIVDGKRFVKEGEYQNAVVWKLEEALQVKKELPAGDLGDPGDPI